MVQASWSNDGIQHPLKMAHGVSGGFATNHALAALLDCYPAELMDINRYTSDAEGRVTIAAGERGQASGAAILDAVRSGRLSINLRGIERAHPDLWDEVQASFAKLSIRLGAEAARKMTGQLIISSPATRTPYHFDDAGVVLFHLRGVKRLFVYPATETFQPQAAMERVLMRTATEELPYRRAFDAAALAVDLKPGEALSWPLYAPHRIENLGGLCVSLSMDFQTWSSRITTGAHRANGVLRRLGLKPAAMANTPKPAQAALWALSIAMGKLGLMQNNIKHIPRTFDLDEPAAKAA